MRKRKKVSSFYIFVVLFFIIIASYAYRYIFLNIDTEIVKYGEMEKSFKTRGIIVRNEWTYNFTGDTEVRNKVEEGERVSFGKKLAEIVKGEELQDDLQIRINKLNERIAEINNSTNENNLFEKDNEKLSKSIDEKVEYIKKISSEGDLEKLTDVKVELSSDLYKKSLISGENSFSGINLEQLKKEKSQLEELYNTNMDTIAAKSAGIVSFNIDGLEQNLNPESISKFSVDDVKSLINSLSSVKNKEEKLNGLKVIDNFSWFLCIIADEKQINGLKEGSRVKLAFSGYDDLPLKAKLKHMSEPINGECLVSFEVTDNIKNFYNVRIADLRIITHEYEGLLVDERCLVELEKQKGVYIIKEGVVKFVAADVISTENGYALIKNIDKKEGVTQQSSYIIKVYDEVVKNINRVKPNQRVL
ncbi:MAG: HlyD family efflux transporter periplasmic adaptor subunit [Lutispora sp.]|nr:HlyD family efflux transporter periplasmic adaptor subunit [Lutispora sp.]